MRARNPEQRLRAFLAICASKRTDLDGANTQPAYRSEGLKITAEFGKRKDEECVACARWYSMVVHCMGHVVLCVHANAMYSELNTLYTMQ